MSSASGQANKIKDNVRKSDIKTKALFFLLLVLIVGLAIISVKYSWQLADKKASIDLFNFIEERLTNLSSS
ncbi:MAG: hypothetical protein ACOZAJ_02870 [Patescibacteria group bacterium]